MFESRRRGLGGARLMRAAVAFIMALALVASLCAVPAGQAFAYFDRGSVEVSLGSTGVELRAGDTASVTVSITPASEQQTEGCGMPKCPQSCAATCVDENGQCRCAGSEYSTYYATATAVSSNSSVAVATYSGGALTVYGKKEGEATITVTASLRQHTDAQATLTVKVSGVAEGVSASTGAFVDVPEVAVPSEGYEDKVDFIEKTAMGRPIHMVRIGDECDAPARLRELAGVDGDVTFWAGDTYYHPAYSLTFLGTDYASGDVPDAFDPACVVSTEATGSMTQPLSGMSDFLVVDFAERGGLFAPATVYADAGGVLADDAAVALFSWDDAAKAFVREGAEASVVGGYAKFTVSEGKTYVVSSRDLTTEAKSVVTGGTQTTTGDSCCSTGTDDAVGQSVLPVVLGVAAVCVVAVAAGVAYVLHRRKAGK